MVLSVQCELRILSLACIGFLLAYLAACGGSTYAQPVDPVPMVCSPLSAPELLSVTVQNPGQESLDGYAIAISLDETVFDFSVPAQDGSDLAVWDATTQRSLPEWLESYDPVAGKGLLWVKLNGLRPQASQRLL